MKKTLVSIVYMLITLLTILLILPIVALSQTQEEQNEKESSLVETDSTASDVYEFDKILVEGERVYSTASSRMIRDFDLNVRPVSTAQDLLQIAPGLVIAQHAGGGKAEQIFLRGLMLTMEQMLPFHPMEFPLIWFHMDTDKDMQTFILPYLN